MVFRFLLFISVFSMCASPLRAQADCRDLLKFGAQGFTVAAAAVELSDSDLRANIPKAAELLFDDLTEEGADFAKLEKVLRENWLVKEGSLTEDKIRGAFSGAFVPYVQLTLDFFTKLELVLAAKPELVQEIREAVLAGLRVRIAKEQIARVDVQVEVQRIRVVDPRFEQTSTGAVFEPVDHPTMGKSVKDEGGMIWSAVLPGEYTNEGTAKAGETITDSDASKACGKIGGRLPTLEDYEKLRGYFERDGNDKMTAQGLLDFHRLFPDMAAKRFWSSSVHPDDGYYAYYLGGDDGGVVYASRRYDRGVTAVRCVRAR